MGNPYRTEELSEKWKCFNCYYRYREIEKELPKGNCSANEPMSEKGCPIYWKYKEDK